MKEIRYHSHTPDDTIITVDGDTITLSHISSDKDGGEDRIIISGATIIDVYYELDNEIGTRQGECNEQTCFTECDMESVVAWNNALYHELYGE